MGCKNLKNLLALAASVKVFETICCFCFWTKGSEWRQIVFCIRFSDLKNKQKSAIIIKDIVIFLDFHSTGRDSHWLILGHMMTLSKIKCIPIVIHLSNNVPRSGCITARDIVMYQELVVCNMAGNGITNAENSIIFYFKSVSTWQEEPTAHVRSA